MSGLDGLTLLVAGAAPWHRLRPVELVTRRAVRAAQRFGNCPPAGLTAALLNAPARLAVLQAVCPVRAHGGRGAAGLVCGAARRSASSLAGLLHLVEPEAARGALAGVLDLVKLLALARPGLVDACGTLVALALNSKL